MLKFAWFRRLSHLTDFMEKKTIHKIKSNKSLCLILVLILLASLFVRTYRLKDLLGFYYDQGRDALVIWNLWHKGKLFLIGPTTGIEGIFRGPWYYWLIAPFYLVGSGDPVWPAAFLAITTVLAIFVLFKLAADMGGKTSAFLAIIVASFSYNLVVASRWLSNPTPMFLISMLIVLSLFGILQNKRWFWVSLLFLLGMAMQFGSAAEIFYFPAVILFAFWQKDKLPNRKIALIAFFALLVAFLPQIVFDTIHNGILSQSIKRFLFEEKSFKIFFREILRSRIEFYYQVFFSKLFPGSRNLWGLFLLFLILSFLANSRNFLKDKKFVTVFILFVSPLVGMIFFQGNYGNVYDYYFTGYYLVFILIFSVLLAKFPIKIFKIILLSVFLYLFLKDNLPVLRDYLASSVEGPTNITLGNELQAVDWVFRDAGERFNVDVYVPPVIPFAYDYLFLWQATNNCGESLCGMELSRRVPLLYTLYEVDPPHPERLDSWLKRQEEIGRVEKTVHFGGITVDKRMRFEQ